MTDVDDFLEHFGVKGMRWGVRKDNSPKAIAKADKKIAKADKKWEKDALSAKTFFKVYNEAAGKANNDLPGINAKYSGKNLKDPKIGAKYEKEVLDNFNKHLSDAASSLGSSPSRTKKLTATMPSFYDNIEISVKEVKHSATSRAVKVERDSEGFIIKIVILDEATHGNLDVDEFLEHYGVKGMRWGVRKRVSSKTRYKTSPNKLTNSELTARIARMEKEKRYNELNARTVSTGEKLVSEILTTSGKSTAIKIASGGGFYLAKRYLAKRYGDAVVRDVFPRKK